MRYHRREQPRTAANAEGRRHPERPELYARGEDPENMSLEAQG
jgi:hypothetical protein